MAYKKRQKYSSKPKRKTSRKRRIRVARGGYRF